jgi:hypothetical protein
MVSVEMICCAARHSTLILYEYIYICVCVSRYEAAGSCGLRKSFDSSIIEQDCLKSRLTFISFRSLEEIKTTA